MDIGQVLIRSHSEREYLKMVISNSDNDENCINNVLNNIQSAVHDLEPLMTYRGFVEAVLVSELEQIIQFPQKCIPYKLLLSDELFDNTLEILDEISNESEKNQLLQKMIDAAILKEENEKYYEKAILILQSNICLFDFAFPTEKCEADFIEKLKSPKLFIEFIHLLVIRSARYFKPEDIHLFTDNTKTTIPDLDAGIKDLYPIFIMYLSNREENSNYLKVNKNVLEICCKHITVLLTKIELQLETLNCNLLKNKSQSDIFLYLKSISVLKSMATNFPFIEKFCEIVSLNIFQFYCNKFGDLSSFIDVIIQMLISECSSEITTWFLKFSPPKLFNLKSFMKKFETIIEQNFSTALCSQLLETIVNSTGYTDSQLTSALLMILKKNFYKLPDLDKINFITKYCDKISYENYRQDLMLLINQLTSDVSDKALQQLNFFLLINAEQTITTFLSIGSIGTELICNTVISTLVSLDYVNSIITNGYPVVEFCLSNILTFEDKAMEKEVKFISLLIEKHVLKSLNLILPTLISVTFGENVMHLDYLLVLLQKYDFHSCYMADGSDLCYCIYRLMKFIDSTESVGDIDKANMVLCHLVDVLSSQKNFAVKACQLFSLNKLQESAAMNYFLPMVIPLYRFTDEKLFLSFCQFAFIDYNHLKEKLGMTLMCPENQTPYMNTENLLSDLFTFVAVSKNNLDIIDNCIITPKTGHANVLTVAVVPMAMLNCLVKLNSFANLSGLLRLITLIRKLLQFELLPAHISFYSAKLPFDTSLDLINELVIIQVLCKTYILSVSIQNFKLSDLIIALLKEMIPVGLTKNASSNLYVICEIMLNVLHTANLTVQLKKEFSTLQMNFKYFAPGTFSVALCMPLLATLKEQLSVYLENFPKAAVRRSSMTESVATIGSLSISCELALEYAGSAAEDGLLDHQGCQALLRDIGDLLIELQ